MRQCSIFLLTSILMRDHIFSFLKEPYRKRDGILLNVLKSVGGEDPFFSFYTVAEEIYGMDKTNRIQKVYYCSSTRFRRERK